MGVTVHPRFPMRETGLGIANLSRQWRPATAISRGARLDSDTTYSTEDDGHRHPYRLKGFSETLET